MPAPPPFQQAKPNVVPSPTFALTPFPTYWEPTGSNTATQSTTQLFVAPFSCLVTVDNEGTGVIAAAPGGAVIPNVTYDVWAWVRQASSGNIGVGVEEYTRIQSPAGSQEVQVVVPGGQFQRVSTTIVMGPTTRFVRPFVRNRTASLQDFHVGLVYVALPAGGSDAARPLQGKGAAR